MPMSWAVTAWPPSRHFWRGCLSIFCVHSSWLFSVRFSTAVHAASPLTSSSHAHDDELGCRRLAAGGGLGGLRATSFISSDRSLLRGTSGVPASALFCRHSGSFFFRELFLAPCTLLLPLPAAQMLMTMSWAVTAWPPVGGLGGRITHRHPRTASTYTSTHTYADSYTHGHRYTHRNHTLPQLTRLKHFTLHT